jgi:hypothetical protein
VPEIDMGWLVGFVNEYADAARAAAGEEGDQYPGLQAPDQLQTNLPDREHQPVAAG